jgi:hypothetical protein
MTDRAHSSSARYHLVLIPGFGGFDALGQVEYYAGVTDLFQDWRAGRHADGRPVVLHYFDNFPTAAVVTRAERLRSYLAKRIARGEISRDDVVTLVGHSTGGLDIRRLLRDLHDPSLSISVDGGYHNVPPEILQGCVRRVVFLSVPHWGTNIADWVRSQSVLRTLVISYLRAAVSGSQVYLVDRLEEGLAGAAAGLTGAEVLLAVQDALTEASDRYGDRSPQRIAAAHEAAAELALYLRHMASDFHVINDLTSQPPDRESKSPAHFTHDQRQDELRQWDTGPIRCLSFLTIGNRPFRFDPDSPAPVWKLTNPFNCPEVQKDDELRDGTDLAYRLCYRACAGGPFQYPAVELSGKVNRRLEQAPSHSIALWDNDGIVNTASMLWPRGDNVLVACDHLDVVGHYKLAEAYPDGGRHYRCYDALRSAPPFDDSTFADIWAEIFEFGTAPF